MTIKEIIEKMEYIEKRKDEGFNTYWYGINKIASFDFKTFHSNRGSYDCLGVNITPATYGFQTITATEIKDGFKSVIGKTFEGWKGGSFNMNENTEVYIADEGLTGVAIKDIVIKEKSWMNGKDKIKTLKFEFITYADWFEEEELNDTNSIFIDDKKEIIENEILDLETKLKELKGKLKENNE